MEQEMLEKVKDALMRWWNAAWGYLKSHRQLQIALGIAVAYLIVCLIGCRPGGFMIGWNGMVAFQWHPTAINDLMMNYFGDGGLFKLILGVLLFAGIFGIFLWIVYSVHVRIHGREAKKLAAFPFLAGIIVSLLSYFAMEPKLHYLTMMAMLALIWYTVRRQWRYELQRLGRDPGNAYHIGFAVLTVATILSGMTIIAFGIYCFALLLFWLMLSFVLSVLGAGSLPMPSFKFSAPSEPDRAKLEDGTIIERDSPDSDDWHGVEGDHGRYRQEGHDTFTEKKAWQ